MKMTDKAVLQYTTQLFIKKRFQKIEYEIVYQLFFRWITYRYNKAINHIKNVYVSQTETVVQIVHSNEKENCNQNRREI